MTCQRHRTISILLRHDPPLLDFILPRPHKRQRSSSASLIHEASLIGAQEELLTSIAIDFLDGGRRTRLSDCLRCLDPNRYDAFMAAQEYARAAGALACRCFYCDEEALSERGKESYAQDMTEMMSPIQF